MDNRAIEYNKQGLRLVQLGRTSEAIEYFTRAIEQDPSFADAYNNRGQAYILLDRFVEGNTDIQRAKNIREGIYQKKKPGKIVKLNLQDVDSIYDSVFPDESLENDQTPVEKFDDSFSDYTLADDIDEKVEPWQDISQSKREPTAFPAVLEYLEGEHLEVAGAVLFKPTKNSISITRQKGDMEQILPIEQLACIRMAGLPGELFRERSDSCCAEIIETIDGSLYHEAVYPEQEMENVLFSFSNQEQTPFTFSFIPRTNIVKRRQERLIGDILLEKRFIAHDILQRALVEQQHSRSLKFGKILAQKARIRYATIEAELEKAKRKNITGLRTGEILLTSGLVNEAQVLDALEYQEKLRNIKIGQFLIKKGVVKEEEVYLALAEQHRLPYIDLRKQKVAKEVLTSLPQEIVTEHEIIPIAFNKEGNTLVVATHTIEVSHLCEPVLKNTRCSRVQFGLTQPSHIRNIISRLYKQAGSTP